MFNMPVVAKSCSYRPGNGDGSARSRMIAERLPAFYMSDFSILGFLVDKLDDAVHLMEVKGMNVIRDGCSVELVVDGPEHLTGIVRFLASKGIDCQVSDLIDEVYQG